MTLIGSGRSGSDDPPQVSVVLPAHNEQLLIESTAATVSAELERRKVTYEIIVVENGSTDETPAISRRLAKDLAQLRVIEYHSGDYGEALYRGIRSALAPIIVTFDVDLFDFDFFDAAMRSLTEDHADIVIASKRAKGAKDRRPAIRRILTFGFMMILRALVGLRVTDAHGMKLLRGALVLPIADACVMRGSLFDVELIVRSAQAGARIVELPVTVRELRPPRTGIVQRTFESLKGAVRLRAILRASERTMARQQGQQNPNQRPTS